MNKADTWKWARRELMKDFPLQPNQDYEEWIARIERWAAYMAQREPGEWKEKFFDADCTLHGLDGAVREIFRDMIEPISEGELESEELDGLLSDIYHKLGSALKEVDAYTTREIPPQRDREAMEKLRESCGTVTHFPQNHAERQWVYFDASSDQKGSGATPADAILATEE